MTNSSLLNTLLEYGNKASLKKQRNLSLSTMTVWKLAEWLGLTEAGIRVSEENEWNEQRAATTGQGIVRTLVVRRF